MPLDPQVKALLDQMAGLPRLEELSVANARKQIDRRIAVNLPTLPVASVLNRSIPGTRWRSAAAHLHARWQGAFPFDGVLSR
jgi:hypothetical protein